MTPTLSPTRVRRATALGGLFVLLAASVGADGPLQTVDAGGVTFQAPSAWKKLTPRSQMRRAQLEVAPVKGDDDPAELIVFAFPGGAGGVDANVKRWEGMFKDKEGKSAKAEVKKVKAKNADATRVEISGHYFPSNFPGQPRQPNRENYRLLGAIVITDNAGYFLRMVGPDKTVAAARPDFEKLVSSLKVTE
jgi:hypothetical protein